jgi:hypothetical protein
MLYVLILFSSSLSLFQARCNRNENSAISRGTKNPVRLETVTSLQSVQCPYCGETFETEIDTSGGSQEYIEDCYVCCRPIVFRVEVDVDGELTGLEVQREND